MLEGIIGRAMKRAFVTGGSGFVGGRLVHALVERGVEVVALARSDRSASTVEALGARAARGDLDNRAAMTAGMAGCDVVFHAAAHTDQFDPLEVHMRITARGTDNALAAARDAGVSRFVHVGTEAVLADGRPIVRADETRPIPAKPLGAYPHTKALAERSVLAADAPGFATVVVRPRFVWGLGDGSLARARRRREGRQLRLDRQQGATRRRPATWTTPSRACSSRPSAASRATSISSPTDRPSKFRAFIRDMLATQGIDAGEREVPRWAARVTVTLTAWMKRPPLTRTAFALMAHEVTVVDDKARQRIGYLGRKTIEAGLAEMRGAIVAAR